MKNYSYPRVTTSVTALDRTTRQPEVADTTVLFVPFISETGPENTIKKIHSLEEYRSTYGIDSERLGLTLLNISNWLTAGGTLYAYRIVKKANAAYSVAAADDVQVGELATDTDCPLKVQSKFKGSYLNGYKLDAVIQGRSVILVKLYNKDGNVVERHTIAIDAFNEKVEADLSNKSEYISKIEYMVRKEETLETVVVDFYETSVVSKKLTFANGTDGFADVESSGIITKTALEVALEEFWADPVAIKNHLETPIELIMDAGYSVAIKKLMIKAISHVDSVTGDVDAVRDDIRGFFDLGNIDSTTLASITEDSIKTLLFDGKDPYKDTQNIFFYNQYEIISEETYFDKDMKVFASYFLSSLIPANDLADGIQFPVAGKRRGELVGVKSISHNPTPDEKEDWFQARVNYVEKDSRGYYFMSQRTFDGSTSTKYNALSFINNSRVTCRMVNDLERIGREYLFEFNDAITLANMSAVMNRYVTNWISNRTLSFGNVEVTADPYSDEKVNAVLNIKFTNTIEVISIDLILQ